MRIGAIDLRNPPIVPSEAALAGCLLLGLISLGTSVILGPLLPVHEPGGAGLRSLLPGALGLVVGMLGLQARRSPTLGPGGRPPTLSSPDAELAAVMNGLRQLLAEERQESASLRQQCADIGNEAVLVGARLAGAALDAETRLAASVRVAEQAMQNPAGALARTAAATRRVEQALAELTDLIKGGLGAAVGDPLAARDTPATDGERPGALAASEAVRTTMADAIGEIAAMTDAAAVLRRDAQALGSAGREIAIAGAEIVQQLATAAGQLQIALVPLPAAADQVASAAGLATQTIGQAAAALGAERAALENHGRALREATVQATDGLREEADALRATAANAAIEVAEALLHAAHSSHQLLEGLPTLTGALAEGADSLRQEAASLSLVGRQVTQAGEQASRCIAITAAHYAAAQQALPVLESAATNLARQASALGAATGEIATSSADVARTIAETTVALTRVTGGSVQGCVAFDDVPARADLAARCRDPEPADSRA